MPVFFQPSEDEIRDFQKSGPSDIKTIVKEEEKKEEETLFEQAQKE